MATDKLYLAQPDLTAQAVVTAVVDGERKAVRTDRTVFHAQGGGQRADFGTIAGVPVTDVRHAEGGEVDHVVADLGGIRVGDCVVLAVDAATRLLHARLHTAGHLIADAAQDVAPTLTPKAGHHWPGEARVEFIGDIDDAEAFKTRLQQRVDALVADDVAVALVGDPYATRAIKIGGGQPVGCGGTHVMSAGELIAVVIRKVQNKKGVVRVSYGVRGEP